jgi:hypothetical protein
MKKIGLFALLFVTWLAGSPVQAAMIVPTGGQLSVGASGNPSRSQALTLAAAYSPFSIDVSSTDLVLGWDQTTSLQQVASASISGTIQPTGLTVTAVANASFYFDANFQETYTWADTMGQIGFDLTAPAQVRIDWNPSFYWGGITSNFTLRGPGGTLLDGISLADCDKEYSSCNFNSPIINLDQGHYELFFNGGTTTSMSIPIDDNYSFSLIVVPIPAGIWLLGSALLGLTAVVRRKTA